MDGASSAQDQENRRIIVADDDDLLRRNIVEILVEAGYAVRAASTGAEARDQFTEEPADLVITDIFMPDMDGIELVRALYSSGQKIRLLAMSGHVGELDYLDIVSALGANHTLRKPFRSAEFLNAVETCLAEPPRSFDDIWPTDEP